MTKIQVQFLENRTICLEPDGYESTDIQQEKGLCAGFFTFHKGEVWSVIDEGWGPCIEFQKGNKTCDVSVKFDRDSSFSIHNLKFQGAIKVL